MPRWLAVGSSTAVRPNGHSEKLASLRHWRANGSPMIVIASSSAQNNQPIAIHSPQRISHRMLPMVLIAQRYSLQSVGLGPAVRGSRCDPVRSAGGRVGASFGASSVRRATCPRRR